MSTDATVDTGAPAVTVSTPAPQVTLITLNRPQRRNAMNHDLLAGLYDALAAAREDRTCRVIILTGAGAGFCAGLDLVEGVTLDTAGMGRAQAGMEVQQY